MDLLIRGEILHLLSTSRTSQYIYHTNSPNVGQYTIRLSTNFPFFPTTKQANQSWNLFLLGSQLKMEPREDGYVSHPTKTAGKNATWGTILHRKPVVIAEFTKSRDVTGFCLDGFLPTPKWNVCFSFVVSVGGQTRHSGWFQPGSSWRTDNFFLPVSIWENCIRGKINKKSGF